MKKCKYQPEDVLNLLRPISAGSPNIARAIEMLEVMRLHEINHGELIRLRQQAIASIRELAKITDQNGPLILRVKTVVRLYEHLLNSTKEKK